MTQLEQLFSPKSIAIIGATVREGAIGNTVVRNFRIGHFEGAVYPINEKYENVEGYPCYASVTDIQENIDLAIIALPSDYVEDAIHHCYDQGIRNVLIFSSGFAEVNESGKILQKRIVDFCKENSIRLLGPNTLGMVNVQKDLALMFQDLGYTVYKKGTVGLVAQSGATGSQVLSMASEEEIGFSYMVATGNQPDVDTIEVLDYYIDDPNTSVGAFYMESVPSGKRFLKMAEKALQQKKPIVGIKSGKSVAGQKAAMSHTASLTGSSEVFTVAAQKYGVTLVDGFEQLIDALKVFQAGKFPKGNRVASVVVSGAVGILLADAFEEKDLKIATLSEATKMKLREEVAAYCSVDNPVDIASTYILNEKVYSHTVQTLVDANEVDIVIVHLPVPTALNPMKYANMFINIAKETEKPIIVIPTGMEKEMGVVRQYLTANDVPSYRTIEAAVQAIRVLLDYENSSNSYEVIERITEQDKIIVDNNEPNILEREVKNILKNADIPIPKGILLTKKTDIENCTLTYPLVAKISSTQIAHKSDIGGIVLKIKNATELEVAYEDILVNVQRNCPSADVEGVYVEEMVTEDFIEFFVGIQNDSLFGPVITCGLGGIFVEVLKDVTRHLTPVSLQEAYTMIEELKGAALLKGARTNKYYDVDALAKAIVSLSNLASNLEGDWQDFEINPLIVLEEGKGVCALDGLITINEVTGVVQ